MQFPPRHERSDVMSRSITHLALRHFARVTLDQLIDSRSHLRMLPNCLDSDNLQPVVTTRYPIINTGHAKLNLIITVKTERYLLVFMTTTFHN